MKQSHFEQQFEAQWLAFAALLEQLENPRRRRASRDNAGHALGREQLPVAYRRLCQHLALARQRGYSSQLVNRLNRLSLRAYQQIYRAPRQRWAVILDFLVAGFPALVRREAGLVGLCSLLFYGPLLLMAILVYQSPELIYSLIDHEQVASLESMYEPGSSEFRSAENNLLMFGFYIYNNISIGFRTFAAGVLFGAGSVVVLLINALFIGAVAGYLSEAGLAETFYPFVIAHGAFELTAIVLAGVAGLRLGLALLSPGPYTRLQALRRAAQTGVQLIYGVFALLLLAAFIEAFWSSQAQLPISLRLWVGACCWVVMALYLGFAGRRGA